MPIFGVGAPPYSPPHVSLDAVGSGTSFIGGASTGPFTLTHTATANALVVLPVFFSSATSGVTFTVQYGTQTMNNMGTNLYNPASGSHATLTAYYVFNALGGAQTITLTPSAATAMSAQSFSYLNAGGFTTYYTSGSSKTPSQTVASATGRRVVQVFGSSNYTLSGYTQNLKYQDPTGPYSMFGEAAGADSVVFGAALGTSDLWGTFAIDIPVAA
jgi:hypothetical protein